MSQHTTYLVFAETEPTRYMPEGSAQFVTYCATEAEFDALGVGDYVVYVCTSPSPGKAPTKFTRRSKKLQLRPTKERI